MTVKQFQSIKSKVHMLPQKERYKKTGPFKGARTPCIITGCTTKRAAVAVKYEMIGGIGRHWVTICSRHLKQARVKLT